MSVKNIFITGAEGKIGTFLVKALSEERRYTLSLLSRANVDSDSGSVLVRHVKGDLCQAESYSSYLNGIDVVLHLGGVTHSNAGSKYYSVNSDATLHLIKACEQTGVKRLIFLSSRTASKEGGDYSYSKLIAEKYVQESSLNWLIFRLSEVYGMNGSMGIDGLLNSVNKLPFTIVIGDGKYLLNPVHILDVVSAITKAINNDGLNNKVYTLAGPKSLTYNHLIDIIYRFHGIKKVKVHIPVTIAKLALNTSGLLFNGRFAVKDQLPRLLVKKSDDISLAVKELNFAPRCFKSELIHKYT